MNWENMCVFMKNMKLDIFNNGKKGVPNNIMKSCTFFSMRTLQKVYPHQVLRIGHICNGLNL